MTNINEKYLHCKNKTILFGRWIPSPTSELTKCENDFLVSNKYSGSSNTDRWMFVPDS